MTLRDNIEWYNKGLEAGKNIAIRGMREKIKKVGIVDIIAKELPVNYDGTNPGNWHILGMLANAILKEIDKEMR